MFEIDCINNKENPLWRWRIRPLSACVGVEKERFTEKNRGMYAAELLKHRNESFLHIDRTRFPELHSRETFFVVKRESNSQEPNSDEITIWWEIYELIIKWTFLQWKASLWTGWNIRWSKPKFWEFRVIFLTSSARISLGIKFLLKRFARLSPHQGFRCVLITIHRILIIHS